MTLRYSRRYGSARTLVLSCQRSSKYKAEKTKICFPNNHGNLYKIEFLVNFCKKSEFLSYLLKHNMVVLILLFCLVCASIKVKAVTTEIIFGKKGNLPEIA